MSGKRALAALLALILLIGAMPGVGAFFGEPKSFEDVPADAWYKNALDRLTALEIINGKDDLHFDPDGSLTRGEFITMLFNATETAVMENTDNSIHWAQPYWNGLNDMGIIAGSGIQCSNAELNKPISRYEMAVLVTNVMYKANFEDKVLLNNVSSVIKDYSSIPANFQYAVEQAVGKGVLSGYTDQTFQGANTLKRCEAASVLYRLLWANDRTKLENAVTVRPDYTPVATQWQKAGWINAYGTASSELRQVLFGDPNKSHFSSLAEAGSYIQSVTIPVWKVDKNGNKYASTDVVNVNAAVAEDVRAIFQQIFDDPEQFPIMSTSSYRNTDTMRHSWGCAIDINAGYNAECRANYNNNTVQFTSGSGWWPVGTAQTMFSGSLTAPSPYSISAGGSVVKAFADYGWGWGGQGYSVRNDNTQKFDYMHFSIMPSGG